MVMWREYKLARLFGWMPGPEMDRIPGDWIDWALQLSREFPDA